MLLVMNYSLTFESAEVLTINIFRKIMFDFKRIIHQTKPMRDPRNVTWFEFCFQMYMIYPGPGGTAKYGKAEEVFKAIFCKSKPFFGRRLLI